MKKSMFVLRCFGFRNLKNSANVAARKSSAPPGRVWPWPKRARRSSRVVLAARRSSSESQAHTQPYQDKKVTLHRCTSRQMRKPSFLTAAHADVGFDNLTGSRIHLTSEERLAGQGVKKLAPKPKEQEPMKSSPVAVGRRKAADVPDSHRFPQRQESQLRTVHRVQRCLQGLLPSSSLAEVSLF